MSDSARTQHDLVQFASSMRALMMRWAVMRSTMSGVCLCAVVLLGVMALACSSPPPGTGYVRGKHYEPAHMAGAWRSKPGVFMCVPSGNGGGITCTQHTDTYWEPNDHWVADAWSFSLENCYSQEGCRTDWVPVGRESFTMYAVGQHYPEPR